MNCRKYERNGSSGREGLVTALSGWLAGGRARSDPGVQSPHPHPHPAAVLPVCSYVRLQVFQKNVSCRDLGNKVHLGATRSRGFAVTLVRLPGIRELVPPK